MGFQHWNRERGRLIDKDVAGTITPAEQAQLDAMQAAMDRYLELCSPRPTDAMDEIEARLSDRAANQRRGEMRHNYRRIADFLLLVAVCVWLSCVVVVLLRH